MASMVEKRDFVKYLAEARSWESDKVQSLENSRRTAWIVAGSSGVLAAISIVTVAMLTPVQRVEAYVVRVDNATGVVNVVRPLENGSTSYDEAVNKYFVQWYVRWREGYLRERSQEYYYNVGITSAPAEQRRYLDQYDPKNSNSPLNVFKADGRSVITINSTTFNDRETATVHFTKEVDFGGKSRKVTQWMAIVHFTFTGARMSDRDREINPLGFQVLNYTVVDETPKSDPAALASKAVVPASSPANAPAQQSAGPAVVTVPAITAPVAVGAPAVLPPATVPSPQVASPMIAPNAATPNATTKTSP